MDSSIAGAGLAVAAGISVGLSIAPIKLMAKYRFEHWAFVNAFIGLLLLPWLLACALCPNLADALGQVPLSAYLKANLCSLAWGTANVLCGLCFVRIGVSMTVGILTGVGLPVGILLPMMVKGSGQFASAPSILSPTGLALLGLTLALVAAVALMARAGVGREKAQGVASGGQGAFGVGLLMAIAAGVLQVGLSFAFVYSQGPLMEALQARGAGESGAIAAVWAATLPGGALVNALFPLLLMLRARNFKTLANPKDFLLTATMSLLFITCLLCMGNGMRMLGALGASLGFGLYQGFQTISSQAVGVFAGEWNGVPRLPKALMLAGVLTLLLGIIAMAIVGA
jgi:hypothetical protein